MRLRRSLLLTTFSFYFIFWHAGISNLESRLGPWTLPWMTGRPVFFYSFWPFGFACLTPSWIERTKCNTNCNTNRNERTNSQASADRGQLPAATQIGDGILRHALQNRRTSFCGNKCRPWDCGWQALPCRVRPFFSLFEIPRPQFRFLPRLVFQVFQP